MALCFWSLKMKSMCIHLHQNNPYRSLGTKSWWLSEPSSKGKVTAMLVKMKLDSDVRWPRCKQSFVHLVWTYRILRGTCQSSLFYELTEGRFVVMQASATMLARKDSAQLLDMLENFIGTAEMKVQIQEMVHSSVLNNLSLCGINSVRSPLVRKRSGTASVMSEIVWL